MNGLFVKYHRAINMHRCGLHKNDLHFCQNNHNVCESVWWHCIGKEMTHLRFVLVFAPNFYPFTITSTLNLKTHLTSIWQQVWAKHKIVWNRTWQKKQQEWDERLQRGGLNKTLIDMDRVEKRKRNTKAESQKKTRRRVKREWRKGVEVKKYIFGLTMPLSAIA